MPAYGFPNIPKPPAKPPVQYPPTHINSMPKGVPSATTRAIKEVEGRQPFDFTEGQRELLARHMIHQTTPSQQELDDYGFQPQYGVSLDNGRAAIMTPDRLADPAMMSAIGSANLKDSGFKGWQDATVEKPWIPAGGGGHFTGGLQRISPNNQKYYAHQRPVNLFKSLANEGVPQVSIDRMIRPYDRTSNLIEAGQIYDRAEKNPLQGYDTLFSPPNYAESSAASVGSNDTLLGMMHNPLSTIEQMNNYLHNEGDVGPGMGMGTADMIASAPARWATSVASGKLPEAWDYATALQSARRHGMGMNPQLPGESFDERMANRELAAQRASAGETPSYQEIARRDGYGKVGKWGTAGMDVLNGLVGDPSALLSGHGIIKGGMKAGVKGALSALAGEAIGEGIGAVPGIAAALTQTSTPDEMSQKDFDTYMSWKDENRRAMMNPSLSPWLRQ